MTQKLNKLETKYIVELSQQNESKEYNIVEIRKKEYLKNKYIVFDYISFAKIISSYGVIALHLK